MTDYTWRQAFEEWLSAPYDDDQEAAFKAGWVAAMAQVVAMVEDLRQETGTDIP